MFWLQYVFLCCSDSNTCCYDFVLTAIRVAMLFWQQYVLLWLCSDCNTCCYVVLTAICVAMLFWLQYVLMLFFSETSGKKSTPVTTTVIKMRTSLAPSSLLFQSNKKWSTASKIPYKPVWYLFINFASHARYERKQNSFNKKSGSGATRTVANKALWCVCMWWV